MRKKAVSLKLRENVLLHKRMNLRTQFSYGRLEENQPDNTRICFVTFSPIKVSLPPDVQHTASRPILQYFMWCLIFCSFSDFCLAIKHSPQMTLQKSKLREALRRKVIKKNCSFRSILLSFEKCFRTKKPPAKMRKTLLMHHLLMGKPSF